MKLNYGTYIQGAQLLFYSANLIVQSSFISHVSTTQFSNRHFQKMINNMIELSTLKRKNKIK